MIVSIFAAVSAVFIISHCRFSRVVFMSMPMPPMPRCRLLLGQRPEPTSRRGGYGTTPPPSSLLDCSRLMLPDIFSERLSHFFSLRRPPHDFLIAVCCGIADAERRFSAPKHVRGAVCNFFR